MTKFLSFLFPFLLAYASYAQIIPDKTSHDFGDLYAHSERFVDFYFKNTGTAKAYILRVEKQANTVYQISSSTILPDSSVVVRIQVSEKKKGAFTIQIPVYLSDRNDPLTLKLKGNIKETTPDLSSLTDCPTFNRRPSDGNPTDFMLTVVTIDKETRAQLGKSRVEVLQKGLVVGDWTTDREGKVQKKIPLGFTYFYASHDGYLPSELGVYVNFRRNYIVLELEKEPVPDFVIAELPVEKIEKPATPKKPEVEEGSKQPKEEAQEIIIEIDHRKSETPNEKRKPKSETPKEPESNVLVDEKTENVTSTEPKITRSFHAPSNIVFVLDISWSMKNEDRLELMKLALISLMEQVRPEDKITVVTYANNAEVIVPTTTGANKKQVIERVSQLTAGGMTAGGKGIQLAYKMAIRNQIPEGNNQIFVITDGAFNKDSQDYERTVQRNTPKGYVLSVVGIKNKPEDEEKMTEVAIMGNGRFVGIQSVSDARTKLFEEVQRASLRIE